MVFGGKGLVHGKRKRLMIGSKPLPRMVERANNNGKYIVIVFLNRPAPVTMVFQVLSRFFEPSPSNDHYET